MGLYVKKSGTYTRHEKGKGRVTYRAGDTIEATEYELRHFMDTFDKVGPPEKPVEKTDMSVATPKDDKPKEPEKKLPGLKLKHRGGNKWNVVNTESGKPINSEGLTKEEAQALVDG